MATAPRKERPVFNWQDPLLLEEELSGEEKMVRDSARAYEDQRIETHVMGEAPKPVVHEVAGRRPCDQVRPQYGFRELPQEHAQNVAPTRAHGLADTDLLGALFGRMSRKPE